LALLVAGIHNKQMIGCYLPGLFLKDRYKGVRVDLGMISRGEVGLIVSGVAISAGTITQCTYASIFGMIMTTTIFAPILLRKAFEKEPHEEATLQTETEDASAPDYMPRYPL
jgi:Kef-type K+ transport system membrane component KefB